MDISDENSAYMLSHVDIKSILKSVSLQYMIRSTKFSAWQEKHLQEFSQGLTNLMQGHDGENVISTLRNGSAAVNAAALMKERGYTHRRRSRHRLTPGTVKFAAFHVLSLEGSKGLTILEVAEKIQVHTYMYC